MTGSHLDHHYKLCTWKVLLKLDIKNNCNNVTGLTLFLPNVCNNIIFNDSMCFAIYKLIKMYFSWYIFLL